VGLMAVAYLPLAVNPVTMSRLDGILFSGLAYFPLSISAWVDSTTAPCRKERTLPFL
jgi:hypothetical protein